MSLRFPGYLLLVVLCFCAGCANITAPTGGRKDITPPKLVTLTPGDSLKNTRVKQVALYFDEYVTVNDPTREVQLSPILQIAPTVTGINKHVVVKIVDSLLEDNTTYRLSFGNAIKDLHEGNAFAKYTYTFSTGAYFDSLQLHGTIKDAETGLTGMEGVTVELYSAAESDSAVVRHKPKYVTKADLNGSFTFKGLPKRTFRIYALKDGNENLVYDGPGPGDKIGFADNTVVPGDTTQGPIVLRVFAEIPDTALKKNMDSLSNQKEKFGSRKKVPVTDAFSYSVNVDTSNAERKSFDITQPIKVNFSRLPVLNYDKITLGYDSMGAQGVVRATFVIDSVNNILKVVNRAWKENVVYTLKLAKGFAKDTAGKDLMPSKYTFRTKEEEIDYGKIKVHLPGKYLNSMYLFRVLADNDSVYQKPVTDTNVVLRFLRPGKYVFRIIVDKNRNGKWDTGDLLKKEQPEEVIAFPETLKLKAGYELDEDFEQKVVPKKGAPGGGLSPK